jgi:hypothetical protein
MIYIYIYIEQCSMLYIYIYIYITRGSSFTLAAGKAWCTQALVRGFRIIDIKWRTCAVVVAERASTRGTNYNSYIYIYIYIYRHCILSAFNVRLPLLHAFENALTDLHSWRGTQKYCPAK